MPFYPGLATGQVFCAPPAGNYEYAGTCVGYRSPNVVITAGHCVRAREATYVVALPTREPWVADRVLRHDVSDIAVLTRPGGGSKSGPPMYSRLDSTLTDGGDFFAYGYPAEADTAVSRFFKGHFQRFFAYPGPSGRKYFAGEMSIPAPAGLSGGPLSSPVTPDAISAIVTTNLDSYLVIDSYEKEERDGQISRGEIKRVVSYGIAAMLTDPEMQSWIDEAANAAG